MLHYSLEPLYLPASVHADFQPSMARLSTLDLINVSLSLHGAMTALTGAGWKRRLTAAYKNQFDLEPVVRVSLSPDRRSVSLVPAGRKLDVHIQVSFGLAGSLKSIAVVGIRLFAYEFILFPVKVCLSSDRMQDNLSGNWMRMRTPRHAQNRDRLSVKKR
jgi:hypothetical protein